MEENHEFTLQKDPWTYGNGSFNPDLHPGSSKSGLRERGGSTVSRQRHAYQYPGEGGEMDGTPDHDKSRLPYEHFSRPPYADEGEDEDDRYYEDRPQRRQFIRRGSEGYEVRPIDRGEMLRRYVDTQPHLAAFASAQERADRGEEGDNYGVSGEEDEADEGGNRLGGQKEMVREVRERVGEPGRYRPYVPERWESDDEDDDEVEQIPNGLPVEG